MEGVSSRQPLFMPRVSCHTPLAAGPVAVLNAVAPFVPRLLCREVYCHRVAERVCLKTPVNALEYLMFRALSGIPQVHQCSDRAQGYFPDCLGRKQRIAIVKHRPWDQGKHSRCTCRTLANLRGLCTHMLRQQLSLRVFVGHEAFLF